MMRKWVLASALAMGAWFDQASTVTAAIYDHDAGSYKHCRLWIPDDVQIIRGVIVNVNGLGDDNRGYANDVDYQAFARNLGFGVIGTQNFTSEMPAEGSRLLNALSYFATVSKHPELKNVPLLMTGFSNGANFSFNFNSWMPSRVIAFGGNKGGYYGSNAPAPGDAARRTPGLFVFGENDTSRWAIVKSVFNANRPSGARWAIAMERGRGHEKGMADALFLPMFQQAVSARYPANQSPVTAPVQLLDVPESSGWLADQSTWGLKYTGTSRFTQVHSFASYPFARGSFINEPVLGSIIRDGWLMDQNNACNYRGFATYDNPIRITSPAPSSSPNVLRSVMPTYSAGATVTINADTTAFGSWSKLELYDQGVKVREITSGAPTFTLSNISGGIHGFMIVGTSTSGAVRTSQLLTVVVRGTIIPPTPTPTPTPNPTPEPPPVPGAWIGRDIGTVGIAGSFTNLTANSIQMKASGLDIWGTQDSFRFVYQPLAGDGSITARVNSIQNTDPWAKAGVMIRETLTSGSKHASMLVTPVNGTAFQRRSSDALATTHTGSTGAAPRWVRIQRKGNVFTAFTSTDGVNFVTVGSETITMAGTVFAGVAVSAHNNATLCNVDFDNVKLAGGISWLNRDVGSVGISGGSTVNNGVFTVKGSGADIWGTMDGFQFVYRNLSGDGSITARIASQQNTDGWAKAGLMIRESLDGNAKHVALLQTPINGLASHARTLIGGSTSYAGSTGAAPQWLRMVRQGSTFTSYRSTDGVNWVRVSQQTISMNASVFAGMAVTSHNNASICTATFDQVN